MSVRKFDPLRAVEIVQPSYGSGYRIGGQLVLTAAHLFEASHDCKVRSRRAGRVEWEEEAKVVWTASEADAALIELPDKVKGVAAAVLGRFRADTGALTVRYDMYGWPAWAQTSPKENPKAGGRHLPGVIFLADYSPEEFLVLEPDRVPRMPLPGDKGSQWAGVSGAAVVCDGLVVAVQHSHQRPDRPSSLEAEPLSKLSDDERFCSILAKHGISTNFEEVAVPQPKPGPESLFCVPHPDPGKRLLGREAVVEALHKQLQSTDHPALLTALLGLGGIGKTQLAVRYCYKYRRSYTGGIVWLGMADSTRAVQELVSWVEQLGLHATDPTSVRAKANALLGRIRNRPDALLVLDNVKDPTLLDRDLPDLPNTRPRRLGCRILVTSRQTIPECRTIRVDFLAESVSRALLLREAGRAPSVSAEAAALDELLGMLGGHALALGMIGAYLRQEDHLSFAKLCRNLRRSGAVTILTAHGAIPSDYDEKIERSFQAVLSETWDALPSDRPYLKAVLIALACLTENSFLPEALVPLMATLPHYDPDGLDPEPLADALRRLQVAQLVERNPKRNLLRLHPLIRAFARALADAPFQKNLVARVAGQLAANQFLLGTPVATLLEIARATEPLAELEHAETEAAADIRRICRMLQLEGHSLRLTAVPSTDRPAPAQLAYAATLHRRPALKVAADQAARTAGQPHFELRWTTVQTSSALRHRLRGHEGRVEGCAMSADGRTGLSVAAGGAPVVWDLDLGEIRHQLRGHGAALRACAISADGQTGLTASVDRTVIVWDLSIGTLLRSMTQAETDVLGCALSADGRIGLLAMVSGPPIVWDLGAGEIRHLLRGHDGALSCAVSADGQTGLSASHDRTLIVWDLTTGEMRRRLSGHEDSVWGCAMSGDGRTGLSASGDETLIVWDLTTGESRHRLRGHKGSVLSCAVSADGRTGLSASRDETLMVWDLEAGQVRRRLRRHVPWGTCALSADGRTALSASDHGLSVWELGTRRDRQPLNRHEGTVWDCAVSRDGRTALSASDDQTLIVWNLTTGELRHRLRGHKDSVFSCAVSADGRTGLSASIDTTLIVWDLERSEMRYRLCSHDDTIIDCAISADGHTGLSASQYGPLIVWNLETGQPRQRLSGHKPLVLGCALSADGRIGFSASWNGILIVWDLDTGKEKHRLHGSHDFLWRGVASSDGSMGICTSGSMLINWDLGAGMVRDQIALAATPVGLALTLSNRLVLIGDGNGDVTCFEVRSS